MGACVSCKAERQRPEKYSVSTSKVPDNDHNACSSPTIAAAPSTDREGPIFSEENDHGSTEHRCSSALRASHEWFQARDTFTHDGHRSSHSVIGSRSGVQEAVQKWRRVTYISRTGGCLGDRTRSDSLGGVAEHAAYVEAIRARRTSTASHASTRDSAAAAVGPQARVPFGRSVLRPALGPAPSTSTMPDSYEEASAASFQLRGGTYLKTRVKMTPGPPIYRLVAADRYNTPRKHWHVARRLALPELPRTAAMPDGRSLDDANIPPMLILHVMMPMYPATLFPTTDGKNCSLIYYMALPEGFDPAKCHAPQALHLLQRLAEPHADVAAQLPIRKQMKMIARIANPEAWLAAGGISSTEFRLLSNYNAKPVLMTPVTQFHRGPNYLEIDFDMHKFSYFARKGLEGYVHRLQPAVWDHAFCLEGRSSGELPEALLACVRGIHWDFNTVHDFPADISIDPGPALPCFGQDEEPTTHTEGGEIRLISGGSERPIGTRADDHAAACPVGGDDSTAA